MGLTRKEVEKVALLSRLQLTDEELGTMTGQLQAIIGYMELLDELNVESVQEMAHPIPITNAFRADELRESLPREQALANAPDHDEECYRVPAVLGE